MERRIGRYVIQETLGEGGMGVVYRARDPVIDREVALKTIRNSEGMAESTYLELRDRFLNEARAAGGLNHPGIVAVLDAGTVESDGVSYIAMEFVSGTDLGREIAAGHRYAPDEAVAIAAEAADALDAAHQRGVVHRDVKPANLMRDTSGRIKVADFGIARRQESSLTRTGQVLGSPAYMSPEQITGARVDHRSDIFSLGVVLYQMLTGERPFLGEGMSTLSYQVVHTEPIAPRKLNPAIPAAYEHVVQRALAKSPDDRYQRAADLAADLRGGASTRIAGSFPAPLGLVTSATSATSATGTLLDASALGVGTATGAAPARAGSGTVLEALPAATTSALPSPKPAGRGWIGPVVAAALAAVAASAIVVAVMSRRGAPASSSQDPAAAATPAVPLATTAGPPVRATPAPAPEATELPVQTDEPAADPAMQPVLTDPSPVADVPSAEPTAAPAAAADADADRGWTRLFVDFEHHIEQGTVVLQVDGVEFWRSELRARKRRLGVGGINLPKVKLANQELTADIEVPAGDHTVTVQVDSDRSRVNDVNSIRTRLRTGRTNYLKIRVSRLDGRIDLADTR